MYPSFLLLRKGLTLFLGCPPSSRLHHAWELLSNEGAALCFAEGGEERQTLIVCRAALNPPTGREFKQDSWRAGFITCGERISPGKAHITACFYLNIYLFIPVDRKRAGRPPVLWFRVFLFLFSSVREEKSRAVLSFLGGRDGLELGAARPWNAFPPGSASRSRAVRAHQGCCSVSGFIHLVSVQ